MRVVSLVPSVTETLLAWGIEPVAVTRFCEQPDYPTVGGTKNPDVDAIAALRPDLVIMDKEENNREHADALLAAGVPLHVTHVTSVDDVTGCLADLAAAVDAPAPPVPAGPGPAPSRRIRAWIPIWRRPWMTVNAATYGSTILAGAGIDNVAAGADTPYPETTLDEAAAGHPDVVLAPSEPYPFRDKHVEELAVVAPVRLVEGKDLFWWGARTGPARRRLADLARELAGDLPPS